MEIWKRFGRGLSTHFCGCKIKTGAGNVLRTLALLRDGELSEKIKVRYSLRMLIRPLSLLRVSLLPFSGKKKLLGDILNGLGAADGAKGSSPPVISMYKDSGLIYTALLQSYGIDLMKTDVDFRLLPLLIAGISEDSALHRVMEIRAAELPAVNGVNAEQVKRLQRLKAVYALKDGDSFGDGMNRLFELAKGAGGTRKGKE